MLIACTALFSNCQNVQSKNSFNHGNGFLKSQKATSYKDNANKLVEQYLPKISFADNSFKQNKNSKVINYYQDTSVIESSVPSLKLAMPNDKSGKGRVIQFAKNQGIYCAETKVSSLSKKNYFATLGVEPRNKLPVIGMRVEF